MNQLEMLKKGSRPQGVNLIIKFHNSLALPIDQPTLDPI